MNKDKKFKEKLFFSKNVSHLDLNEGKKISYKLHKT